MSESDTSSSSEGGQGRPLLCEVCGRPAGLEWHCISADVDDRHDCQQTSGQGYWLCAELCHPTAHRRMAERDDAGRAGLVVLGMVRRLASAVQTGRRAYRRKRRNTRSDDGAEGHS